MRQVRLFARWRLLPACAFFLLAVTGCGKSASVKGKITFDGKDIPEGEIIFIGPGDKRATGGIKNGEYEVKNAPIGECTVLVDTSKAKMRAMGGPGQLPPGMDPNSPAGKKMLEQMKKEMSGKDVDKVEYMPIPDDFNDPKKSKLTFTVEKGSNEKDFDLEKPKGWTPPKNTFPGRPGGR
jgi:hypothetical protein